MLFTKGLLQNIASNIERISVNQLISISPDIHEKNRGILMISGMIEVKQFA